MEDRMDKAVRAVSLFHEGFNCSQSVCTAFSEGLGFNQEQALKVSSAFGGGTVEVFKLWCNRIGEES